MPGNARIDPFRHSVPMEFDWETDNPDMEAAVDELFFLMDGVPGHTNLLRKHLRLVLIVCSRMYKHSSTAYIGYVRDNNYASSRRYKNPLGFTTRPLIKVIDVLASHGFLEHYIGFNGTVQERRSSRFKATGRLTEIIQDYGLQYSQFSRVLIRGGMVLKDERKRYVYDYEDTEEIVNSRNILTAYNAFMDQFSIGLSRQLSQEQYWFDNVQSFRVFNNSSFLQGGRFYGNWWFKCKREDRPYITINGYPTAELDYKANHLYFIYALEDVIVPSFPHNDPYGVVLGVENRDIIKSVFTIAINASNEFEAYGAITKHIKNLSGREDKARWRQFIHGRQSFRHILSLLVGSHPVLESYLCSGIGVKLQFMDSQVAEYVLNDMTRQESPTLSIHDSFIVSRDKEQSLRDCMEEAYRHLGYPNHIPFIEAKIAN